MQSSEPVFSDVLPGSHSLHVGRDALSGEPFSLPVGVLEGLTVVVGRFEADRRRLVSNLLSAGLDVASADGSSGPVLVVDLVGDLVSDLMVRIPASMADRTRLLLFGSSEQVPAVNLLDPDVFPDMGSCVENLALALRSSWARWGVRTEDLVLNGLRILYRYNSFVPSGSEKLSFLDLIDLFGKGVQVGQGRDARIEQNEFQRRVMSCVPRGQLHDWFNSYMEWSSAERYDALAPIFGRLSVYSYDARSGVALGSRSSAFDFKKMFLDDQLVLVSLAQGSVGSEPAYILGSALMGLFRHLSMSRGHDGAGGLLVCDGFDMLPGMPWRSFSGLPGRGFGMVLSGSTVTGLAGSQDMVLDNADTLAFFGLGVQDAEIASRLLSSEVTQPRSFSRLAPGSCYIRPGTPERRHGVSRVDVEGVSSCVDTVDLEGLKASWGSYTVPWELARASLDARGF